MKLNKIQNAKIGDKVVVNDLPDATVYTIAKTRRHNQVELQYPIYGGRMASAGWMDLSCCYVPTKDQLVQGA